MKTEKIRLAFLQSAGVLLSLTAAAKFITAMGRARILDVPDPVLMVKYRYIFWTLAPVELSVALVCFFGTSDRLKRNLLAWLVVSFCSYRITSQWIGREYCKCLGYLTDALHISPGTADSIASGILGYLAAGVSLIFLFDHRVWLERKLLARFRAPFPSADESGSDSALPASDGT